MIGLFDSGSGGLTVLQAIRAQAPNVDIAYIGDIANAPYGLKDQADIERLTMHMIRELRARGATHLVSACNSISTSVIRPLFDLFGVQESSMTEMVGPTIDALRCFSNKRIVIFTTIATQRSGMYQAACVEHTLDATIVSLPRLAGLIEASAPSDALRNEVEEGMAIAQSLNADVVVLGCTHFPLIRELFEQRIETFSRSIKILDPAPAVALKAITAHGTQGTGKTDILITQDSPTFRDFAQRIGIDPSAIDCAQLSQPLHYAHYDTVGKTS